MNKSPLFYLLFIHLRFYYHLKIFFFNDADLRQEFGYFAHEMKNRLPKVIDFVITPSTFAKSTHNNVFMEILDLCGFPNERLDALSTDDLSELKLEDRQMRNDLDYQFNFKNQQEQASYAPLENFSTTGEFMLEM